MFRFFLCIFFIAFLPSMILAQGFVVSGTVVDEAGAPLSGIFVESSKQSSINTTTNADGQFTINLKEAGDLLLFSGDGFELNQVAVLAGQTSVGTVRMVRSEELLEDVVVVGYGLQRKELVSGSVASISSETVNKNNPVRVDQALQGKVAGVQINSNSGSPGSGFNILIRGVTTNGDNSPLILLDGIPMGGDLSIIDPNDIEKIDVIKDASTAIYGVRGANGVVLITTKKGRKNQKTKFTYSGIYSIQSASKKINLMNAKEYSAYVNESEVADGKVAPYTDLADNLQTTDWQSQLFQSSPMTSHNLSAIGGGEKVLYNFSGSYLSQKGIIAPAKSFFDRFTLKSDVQVNLTNKLKLKTFLLYTEVKKSVIPENGRGSVLYYALNASPRAVVLDGTDNTSPSRGFAYISSNQGNEIINPLALIHNTYNDTRNNRFSGKAELSYNILDKLVLTSRYSFNYAHVSDRFYSPLAYYGQNKVTNNVRLNADGEFDLDRNADGDRDVYSSVSENVQRYFDYTWETFATYDFALGKNNFSLLAGISLLSAQYQGYFTSGFLTGGVDNWDNAFVDNTQSFIIDKDNNGTNDIQETKNASTGRGDDRLASWFFRVQYDHKGKYLFSGMVRQDGSNRFGPANRIGYFPSFSAGWVVDKEKFFNVPFIDKLKVRASWGITGNDKIGSYRWLGFLQGATAEATYPFNNVLVQGNATGSLPNPDLQWETNQQFDIGVDVGFLRNRVELTFDYYIKQTDDLLITPEVSGLLGAAAGGSSAPVVNAGSVRNAGVDLRIAYRNDIKNDFQFTVAYNLSHYRNKVIQVNNAAGFISGGIFGLSEQTSRMQTGLPLGVFYGLQADGIFQTQADVDAHATQEGAQVGGVRYKDIDGDGVVNFGSEKDLTVIGSPIPDVIMGLSFNFEFKNFDFGFLLYASIGNEIVRSYERFLPYSNRLALYLNRWRGVGSSNTIPLASNASSNNYVFSSLFVEDGSYLRIQNIQLGYSLPDKLLKKIKLTKARLYVAVNNLYTFTSYLGYDPDISNASPVASGVDQGQYPQARLFTVGTTISF